MNRIISDYYSRSPIPLNIFSGWQLPPLTWAIIKGPHQRRMTLKCANAALGALTSSGILQKSYNNFDDLYTEVHRVLIGIPGVGNLTCYDVALRVGRYFTPWLVPFDYVYVAQGALVGARKLLGTKIVKKNLIDGVKLPASLFASLFPGIPSAHIEDMLCIYKDYFVQGGVCGKYPTMAGAGNCASGVHKKTSACGGACCI